MNASPLRPTAAAPPPSSSPERVSGERVGAVLADVAAIGPWFAVPTPAAAGSVRWDALYDPPVPGRPDPLGTRIDEVATALGGDRRVGASVAVMGLAARIVSMPFAAVALHGVLPSPGELRRDPGADDPWAPGLPGGAGGVATPDVADDPAAAADLLARALADTHLEPLYAAVTARAVVSPRVLRGNVVSSIAGAARVMEAVRRPDRRRYLALLDALADHPALRGPLPSGATGRLVRLDDDPDTEWAFRRRSCCLYVRAPGGGTCGDCVLAGRA
ncbi:(2Fe-2S)-binding protein [Pseudonocardia sp. ICBG1293]|uniref:(2Fe-2S)-binding protein n=1 Tax=Pseudonocardia sp. ICBG1293 TaxID=2844382 RepID=UPI001CC9C2F0|nr:(2Fe-2S)-binding protein [Pseudonocardia sp. ICBG1293]